MYNEELNEALESAYNNGYTQALLDMDADIDNKSEECINIFDDSYFSSAIESGRAKYNKLGVPLNSKAKKYDYEMKYGEELIKRRNAKSKFSDERRKRVARKDNLNNSSYYTKKDDKGNPHHYSPNAFRYSNRPAVRAKREYLMDTNGIDMSDTDNKIRYSSKRKAFNYASRDGHGTPGYERHAIQTYHTHKK